MSRSVLSCQHHLASCSQYLKFGLWTIERLVEVSHTTAASDFVVRHMVVKISSADSDRVDIVLSKFSDKKSNTAGYMRVRPTQSNDSKAGLE